jgi:hypothetical protein
MRKRLADPQLREELRAEQRTQIDAMHPDLAHVVGLDPRTASELIELLTDQQMSVFDRIHGGELQAPNSVAMTDRVARNAQEGTRRLEELRSLLGEQGFERYRDYQNTLRERLQVTLFEEHLQPGDELTLEQKSRLMSLLQWQAEQTQRRTLENRSLVPPAVYDPEALRKQNIAANEKSFWRTQEESRLLISRAAEVLTQRQIDVFARMEADKIDVHRAQLEQVRVDAGMSREIPSPAETDEGSGRQPISGQVRLEVSVRVDGGEPVLLCLLTENGKAASFEGPEPLWVETTPTVFADGHANVRFNFWERRDGRRRAVTGWIGIGARTGHRESVPLGTICSVASISGSKVYAIELDVRVTPVEQQ